MNTPPSAWARGRGAGAGVLCSLCLCLCPLCTYPPPARRLCDFPVLPRYPLLGGASTELVWILGQSGLGRFSPGQLPDSQRLSNTRPLQNSHITREGPSEGMRTCPDANSTLAVLCVLLRAYQPKRL
jgi:hypothetical protein